MVQLIACVQASCHARETVSFPPCHYKSAVVAPFLQTYAIAIEYTLQFLQLHPLYLYPHALDPPSKYPSPYRLGA